MHRSALVILLAAACSAGAVAQSRPARSDFFIYLWRSPKIADPDARARALADAGFTVVDWDAGDVDRLRAYGLRAMVHTPALEVAAGLAANPAVWGYHLGDEPWPEAVFPSIAGRFRAIERADPNHVPFVNMLSTTGALLRSYMDIVRPPILSFDYYQWWWGSDRYYEKLEQFREAAVGAGVPLAACFEVSANPGVEWGDTSRLPDNAARLRQSVYTSLAYGVTGIEWFNADMAFEEGTGTLTPAGRDVAGINRDIREVGRLLASARSIDVFHTAPVPAGARSAPREHWVQLVGEEGRTGFVMGLFQGEPNVDYVLVANRDYRESQTAVVKLQSKWLGIAPWYTPKQFKYAVDRLDQATGHWTTLTSSSSVGFSYVVGAASGELFRVRTTIVQDGKAEGWPR